MELKVLLAQSHMPDTSGVDSLITHIDRDCFIRVDNVNRYSLNNYININININNHNHIRNLRYNLASALYYIWSAIFR